LAERISAAALKPQLTDGREIAFLDVREHGQYGEGHPFFSVPMPYSLLESRAAKLLPCRLTRIVLMDDGDGVADKAAARLGQLGYEELAVLEGGAPGWAAAGFTLYKGVNVPSKTFGELLEHACDTPRLTAEALQSMRERDNGIVVLDGRTPAEFEKMSLPGAGSCPNAELGYRLSSLVSDDETTIVINCAGRTRSILGVEGLRLLDVRNPVYALENGTQGWRLAGFELAHGVSPGTLAPPKKDDLDALRSLADSLIGKHGLELAGAGTVEDWLADGTRTTYLLDVRTDEEFAASHWPGARHAPGGQLVQATDEYVAVRNARIVLTDDIRLRAATTAVRLREMGHDVYILDADATRGGEHAAEGGDQSCAAEHGATAFRKAAADADVILDASRSMDYRDAHIDGAHWVSRARLASLDIDPASNVLVTGRNADLVDGVRTDLAANGFSGLQACSGNPDIWAEAGFNIVSTPDDPPDERCIDYLFFVHDRHAGNLDAARRYLEWETGLVDQLDAQERSVFRPGSGGGADSHA
jgi:rhodanese-related sulfurtransferase